MYIVSFISLSVLYLEKTGFRYRRFQKQQTHISISKKESEREREYLSESLEERHNKHMDGKRERGN